jgi:hypothetical protein
MAFKKQLKKAMAHKPWKSRQTKTFGFLEISKMAANITIRT